MFLSSNNDFKFDDLLDIDLIGGLSMTDDDEYLDNESEYPDDEIGKFTEEDDFDETDDDFGDFDENDEDLDTDEEFDPEATYFEDGIDEDEFEDTDEDNYDEESNLVGLDSIVDESDDEEMEMYEDKYDENVDLDSNYY